MEKGSSVAIEWMSGLNRAVQGGERWDIEIQDDYFGEIK